MTTHDPFFVVETHASRQTVQALGVERLAEEMAEQCRAAVLARKADLEERVEDEE